MLISPSTMKIRHKMEFLAFFTILSKCRLHLVTFENLFFCQSVLTIHLNVLSLNIINKNNIHRFSLPGLLGNGVQIEHLYGGRDLLSKVNCRALDPGGVSDIYF